MDAVQIFNSELGIFLNTINVDSAALGKNFGLNRAQVQPQSNEPALWNKTAKRFTEYNHVS